jgi:predicted AAA+ superfamily ATPase
MQGMRRKYEKLLKEYISFFPCAALIGSRQCGKTTLLKTLSNDWHIYDLEKQSDFQNLIRDPDLFFRLNPDKVAIDEAQLLPELFSALRVAVDSDRERTGRFVITGSSSPKLIRSISESLAGRIGMIEMAPFSFSEVMGELSPPFFQHLADRVHIKEFINLLKPLGDIREVHEFWFKGGYPEPWLKKSKRFHSTWMNQYVGTYLYRDVAKLFPGINENRFRLFVQILSGISGNTLNYSDAARSLGVSQPTVRDYFEIADATFLWRTIPAYTRNTLKRIVKHPKGYLRDSGLLHHLMRIPEVDFLVTHPAMGRSWEGLVIEELIRGLNAIGVSFDYYYFRTGGGAEVDLILDGEFGLIPIEIKYTQSVPVKQLRSLKDFIKDQNCRFGLVINNDERPRMYDDKIAGIPFACL